MSPRVVLLVLLVFLVGCPEKEKGIENSPSPSPSLDPIMNLSLGEGKEAKFKVEIERTDIKDPDGTWTEFAIIGRDPDYDETLRLILVIPASVSYSDLNGKTVEVVHFVASVGENADGVPKQSFVLHDSSLNPVTSGTVRFDSADDELVRGDVELTLGNGDASSGGFVAEVKPQFAQKTWSTSYVNYKLADATVLREAAAEGEASGIRVFDESDIHVGQIARYSSKNGVQIRTRTGELIETPLDAPGRLFIRTNDEHLHEPLRSRVLDLISITSDE